MKHVIHQIWFSIAVFIAQSVGHQNVPPGVHPSHYQQQQQVPIQHHMPVQQQHIPVQQQHIPVQQQQQIPVQQQMPVQHMPVQQQGVPMQQQPVMQQQVHGQGHHHDGPPQVLNVANIAQEKKHIEDHLTVPMDTSKMTEQELQFHYFKMHDADNNNKLDGCELIKSLIHWHGKESPEIHQDEELEKLVDVVLKDVDRDMDGYITYAEFLSLK